ncbi:MAG: ribose 5-phosphate isomerase B [Acidobacteria bacterium]|nr:ribose 5-phosphate isomerase B [Acidobacteriota bacterium]MBI3656328.1 ribose 5-phosphate isomerase B [Acidobacteriota bacterium]
MSQRRIITEQDVLAVEPGGLLEAPESSIITPLARETASACRVRIILSEGLRRKVIGLGADHGGFEVKEQLKPWLDELGYAHKDFGTHGSAAVDYPDFAFAVANAVAKGDCDLGIILDGAGIGSCMTANKVPGVRAAMCYDAETAKNSREHNYANVLTLGARLRPLELLREIVKVWLATDYGEERHGRRVRKIMDVEKRYLR